MRHLVSDDSADGTVVESVVRLRVEERRLKYACGEADLVCRGVVVGIDCLRRHEPFGLVNRLAYLLAQFVESEELVYVAEVLVERQCVSDFKSGVVSPFVGVSDFHDEVAEFVLSLLFCLCAHPCCLVDAL